MDFKYKLIKRNDATQTALTFGNDNTVIFGGEWGSKTKEEANYIWVENKKSSEELKTEADNKIFNKLQEIDMASIRPLRACLVSLAEGKTPEKLDLEKIKEKELQAIEERSKLL
jgi:hypothetical protein